MRQSSGIVQPHTDVEFRQNALINGTFPDTMYRDADELEGDLYAAKSWLDWPLTGSDGSVAALVALVSDMKVGPFLILRPRWLAQNADFSCL